MPVSMKYSRMQVYNLLPEFAASAEVVRRRNARVECQGRCNAAGCGCMTCCRRAWRVQSKQRSAGMPALRRITWRHVSGYMRARPSTTTAGGHACRLLSQRPAALPRPPGYVLIHPVPLLFQVVSSFACEVAQCLPTLRLYVQETSC